MRRATLVRCMRAVFLGLVLVAAVAALWRNWTEVSETLATLAVRTWLPSLLAVPVGIACATMSWQVLVDDLGSPVGPARGGQIFLVGQLGKYVPGSVWAYFLQLELGRRAGVARARVFTATLFSLAVAVVAALTVGSLAIPSVTHANPGLERLRWLYVLLPFGIVGLHPRVLSWTASKSFQVLGRPALDHRIRKRTVARSLGWALASYLLFGVHVWLLTREVVVPTFENFGLTIGAMALAMISGFFFFVLPSGAGVREAVLVAALAPLVGSGRAVAYAAISRVFLTIGDLSMAGTAAALAAHPRRRAGPYQGDPGIDAE